MEQEVRGVLALQQLAQAGERKAQENLNALQSSKLTSDMFFASKAATALLKEMNKLVTPEMIEESEVDRLVELKKADDCYKALMGGARPEVSLADISDYRDDGATPAVPRPAPVQLEYDGGAAAAPQRQSARVAARQLAEA